MKNTLLILVIFLSTGIYAQHTQQNADSPDLNYKFKNNKAVLDFYKQYSYYTNPGEYEYLYKDLPDSLPQLCRLIQKQFLHLIAQYPRHKHKMPAERRMDFTKYTTVESILAALQSYDSAGLTLKRKPQNRLVMTCQNYSLLLASMLKYKGIPTRVRYGHASYLIPDFYASHVICEVWNADEKRWMLVDPNLSMVDFSADKFELSNVSWLRLQNGEIDPEKYGFPGKYTGIGSIVGKISGDMAAVLGTEFPLTKYAPIMDCYFSEDKELSAENIQALNDISELMINANAKSLTKLQKIYQNTPTIQNTKTRDLKYLTGGKKSETNNSTTAKP